MDNVEYIKDNDKYEKEYEVTSSDIELIHDIIRLKLSQPEAAIRIFEAGVKRGQKL